MSTVQEPGSARPGRLLGLILIGVAVIAVVLGVITLINGGNSDNNAGGGTPPSSTSPSGSTTNPPSPPSSNRPSSPAPPPNTSTQPPATTTTTNQPAPPPPANNRSVPIRVLNNSKIPGLAAQATRDFRADGWNVVDTGNYSQGIIPTSTAYFRPGTPEEAAAQELAKKFGMKADARFPGIANASPGVIVIVTNDYGSK